jgi:serine/threonine protein kinase
VALVAGETFARYTIEERIGLGGLGDVYRALDTRLLRHVAIKIIRRDRTSDWEAAVARFLREARVAASLHHPNTVAIHDLGEVRGTLFLVMELVRGTTLRSFISDASIPLEVKLDWLAGIGRGLAAAHDAGIVHRDVKPGNIMITSEGIPKMLDFGLAKSVDDEHEDFTTKVGQLLGTPRYMAPEQREGREADARSDQYSFGVTAYELLAMVHPDAQKGERQPLRVAAPIVDPSIASSIDRMLSIDPDKRFPSMPAATAAIEAFARTNSISIALNIGAYDGAVGAGEPSTTEQFVPSVVRAQRATETTLPPPAASSAAPPPDQTAEMSTRVRAIDPRAESLTRAFAERFASTPIGPAGYVVEFRATEQASHPLILVPRDAGYAAIVIGSVSFIKSSAEIRGFDYIALMHAQRRTSKPFADRSTYEKSVLKRLKVLLKENGVTSISVVAPPPELRQAFATAQTQDTSSQHPPSSPRRA